MDEEFAAKQLQQCAGDGSARNSRGYVIEVDTLRYTSEDPLKENGHGKGRRLRNAGGPGEGGGEQPVQREDLLLLLEGLSGKIRRESNSIREVSRPGAATPNTVWPPDRRTGAHGV